MTQNILPDQTTIQEPLSVDDNAVSLTVDGTVTAAAQPGVDIGDVTVNNAAGASAVNIQDGGNSITVDGTVTATPSGDHTVVGKAADGAAVSGNPVLVAGFDGTLVQTLKLDTAGEAQVDVLTLPALVAGTANIGDVDIASVVAGTSIEVIGDVASDIAVPANPVTIGGRASTAVPAAMSADGDSANLWLNRQGVPMVSMAPHLGLFGSQPWNLTSETAQYITIQTSAVLVAGGASERIVVTSIQIQAGGTVAGTLQVYFGTGAYVRGTNLAIFDGEFAPSATLKPGVVMQGPFISATNGDDILVTDSAAINPLTITVWYYVVT